MIQFWSDGFWSPGFWSASFWSSGAQTSGPTLATRSRSRPVWAAGVETGARAATIISAAANRRTRRPVWGGDLTNPEDG